MYGVYGNPSGTVVGKNRASYICKQTRDRHLCAAHSVVDFPSSINSRRTSCQLLAKKGCEQFIAPPHNLKTHDNERGVPTK